MRRHCQITVKRSEKRVDLTVAPRTTTLRRSSGGVGWFSCMEADRLLSEQFGGTQLVIIVGVEFCENDVEI